MYVYLLVFVRKCVLYVYASRLSWNGSEDAVVYTAESKPTPTASLFAKKATAARGTVYDLSTKEV